MKPKSEFTGLRLRRSGGMMGWAATHDSGNRRTEMLNEEQIAKVCHEVNRAYCQALGDNSQPAWEDAPDWQKESAVHGVRLHTLNPDAGPEASHESWMAQKLADGWTYGTEKLWRLIGAGDIDGNGMSQRADDKAKSVVRYLHHQGHNAS